MYHVFYMSLLEQDITKKRQVDKIMSKLEFVNGKSKNSKYEIKTIWNSAVYAKQSETKAYLSNLYYLILWKEYSKKDNTWKPALAIE